MEDAYVSVKCEDCENEQRVFRKASTQVSCQVCGRTLAKPTGGEAEIEGELVDE